MKISVIIPAYNEEKYIADCLTAIKAQETPPYEVIVIDNNSTDHTAQIAASFGARVVKEMTQGISPARHRGFHEATGDIIARTDADSAPRPDWLTQITKSFTEHPDAVGITGPITYHNLSPIRLKLANAGASFYIFFLETVCRHPVFVGSNMVIKREIAQTLTCIDDRLAHEDIDISCQVVNKGTIIVNPNLIMRNSARRMLQNPKSFFIEYPYRLFKTLSRHFHYH